MSGEPRKRIKKYFHILSSTNLNKKELSDDYSTLKTEGIFDVSLSEINKVSGLEHDYYQCVLTVINNPDVNGRTIFWNASGYGAMGTRMGDLIVALLKRNIANGECIDLASLIGLKCRILVRSYKPNKWYGTRIYEIENIYS